jgi:hypothetical protein
MENDRKAARERVLDCTLTQSAVTSLEIDFALPELFGVPVYFDVTETHVTGGWGG